MCAEDPPRLRLEAPGVEHAEAFLAAVRRSETLHHPWTTLPATPAAYRRYLDVLSRDDHLGYLVVAHEGALAGVVTISQIVRGVFQSGYLAYAVFVPWDGRGVMTAGLGSVVGRAFGLHDLHRLEANIQPENEASIALVRRLGFVREGFSRRYLKIGGAWRDHERWAITAEAWPMGGAGAAF